MSEKQTVDRRQMLKDAAIQLACRNGYERTTIKQIAKQCDVTVGVIYHYFASKEELFREALTDHLPNFEEVLPEAARLTIEEGLVKIATIMINGLRQRAEMITVIVAESFRNPEILSLFLYVITQARKLLEEYFAEKIRAREIAPVDVRIISNMFFGHFFTAFFHRERLGMPFIPPIDEDFIKSSVKTMIAGWKQGDL